jgi:hypothetical protein
MFVSPCFHLIAKNYTGIRQKQAVNCKLFAISSVKKNRALTPGQRTAVNYFIKSIWRARLIALVRRR